MNMQEIVSLNTCVQEWTLSASQAGHVVQLTFETFGLEDSENCEFDFVEVSYDSYSVKFCGYSIPGPLVSTGATMTVRLQTDFSQTGQGFKAEWETIFEQTTTTSTQGPLLSHPSYPANYENDYEKVNGKIGVKSDIRALKHMCSGVDFVHTRWIFCSAYI